LELKSSIQTQIHHLSDTLNKLDQQVIRVAAFGLVSRGKSAVLNALLNQPAFATGAVHGVTQWPRSVRWLPSDDSQLTLELIDTPGLDEVAGQARAQLAREVAQQADLILFVIAGDITRTEYQALGDLAQTRKPVLLVFNKTDLYPDQDQSTICQKLQALRTDEGDHFTPLPQDIVLVAADPTPIPVQTEWPDGRTTQEWEPRPPHITPLKQKILGVVRAHGVSLLALNALQHACQVQKSVAHQTLTVFEAEADALIFRFVRYKALAVACNPIAVLDMVVGAIADLALIRSLAQLYRLPITNHEVERLWRTILLSSGGLLLAELVGSTALGLGKSLSAIASTVGGPWPWSGYVTAAVAQGAWAGYGVYTVGRATQIYLEQGCTWGEGGPSTVMQHILRDTPPTSILSRFQQELLEELN